MLLSFPETQNVPPIRNLVESSLSIHSRFRGKHGLLPPRPGLKMEAKFRIRTAKEETGFKNEANERKKADEETASLKEKGSPRKQTEVAMPPARPAPPWPVTFVRPALRAKLTRKLDSEENRDQRVEAWSMTDMTGLRSWIAPYSEGEPRALVAVNDDEFMIFDEFQNRSNVHGLRYFAKGRVGQELPGRCKMQHGTTWVHQKINLWQRHKPCASKS